MCIAPLVDTQCPTTPTLDTLLTPDVPYCNPSAPCCMTSVPCCIPHASYRAFCAPRLALLGAAHMEKSGSLGFPPTVRLACSCQMAASTHTCGCTILHLRRRVRWRQRCTRERSTASTVTSWTCATTQARVVIGQADRQTDRQMVLIGTSWTCTTARLGKSAVQPGRRTDGQTDRGLYLNLSNKLAAVAMDRQTDGYVLENVLAVLTIISETNRIQLALSGMQNRTFRPYLAGNSRILISLMNGAARRS
jgi:hypothetical protein